MHLIEILLPLRDRQNEPFPAQYMRASPRSSLTPLAE